MVIVLDAGGGITYASPAFRRMLGYREDARVGQNVFELIHPDDVGDVRARFGEHLAGLAQSAGFGFRFLAADGSWRNIEALANNLLDDPAVGGVVFNCRDVTERTRAEGQLAGQAQVLDLIARDAPLMETLDALAKVIEAEASGARCAILLLDDVAETLTVAAAPSLIDVGLHEADGLVHRARGRGQRHRRLPARAGDLRRRGPRPAVARVAPGRAGQGDPGRLVDPDHRRRRRPGPGRPHRLLRRAPPARPGRGGPAGAGRPPGRHRHRAQPRPGPAGPPGRPRRPHRPAQPGLLPGQDRPRPGPHPAQPLLGGRALPGPGPVQVHQRLARPRRRRPAAGRPGQAPPGRHPARRHRGPLRRRRVHHPLRGHRRRGPRPGHRRAGRPGGHRPVPRSATPRCSSP